MATQESLRQKRPYIIVAAFVLGMLLTPPDIISQTLLAVPVWLLFELGVYFSGWFMSLRDRDNDVDGTVDKDKTGNLSEAEMEAELDRTEANDKRGS
jgi:sec-independent protein translocase protein TatC